MRFTKESSISISIYFVHSALRRVRLERAKIDRLLQSSRIPTHLLEEPHARVSLAQYSHLLTSLMKASNDEMLGHTEDPIPVGTLSLLSHWLISTKTMNQALHRLKRFYQIVEKGLKVDFEQHEDQVHIWVENLNSDRPVSPFLAEFSFFCVHRIFCWLRKEIIPIEGIRFQFSAPVYARDYRLMFYGAPSEFDCERTEIRFSSSLLRKSVQQNLSTLEEFLKDPNAELLMQSFNAKSWAAIVADEIKGEIDDLPTLPQLAQRLNTKPYTLQRRLADEGISYLAIKNQVKRDAAIDLLVNSDLSIEEISTQLGFSEISPFTRCFKNWTGIPPSAYRKYQ